MKDFMNNELKVNDYIAFARNPYADLMLGKIVGFTLKGIKIIKRYKDGTWGADIYYDKNYEVIFPYQCVKVDYNE